MTTQNQLLREALHDIEQAHDLSLDFEHYASRQVLVSIADKIKTALAQPAEGGEVVAWRGELAHGIDEHGKGQDWRWHTMEVKPQVPAHFIRNLRPLTYADTTPPASHDQDNDELDRLRKELNRIKLVGSCGTVDSWLSLSDEQKREWFATTLHRDSEQTKTIRELEHQLASQGQAQQPRCKCGDRAANQCDEEWGPKCDLGNNEKYVRVAQQPKPQPMTDGGE